MCGRFGLVKSYRETFTFLYQQFGVELKENFFPLPHYNLAPTQSVLTLIHDGNHYRLGQLQWGFSFPNLKNTVINLRTETIHEKLFFRQALYKQRCLIIASGYYEWQQTPPKQPYWISPKDHSWMMFAGIYRLQLSETGEKKFRTAILTTAASDQLSTIHHRTPVILNSDQYYHWLNPKTPIDELTFLFRPNNFQDIQMKRVGFYVNSVHHNDEQCLSEPPSLS